MEGGGCGNQASAGGDCPTTIHRAQSFSTGTNYNTVSRFFQSYLHCFCNGRIYFVYRFMVRMALAVPMRPLAILIGCHGGEGIWGWLRQ